jgi:glucose-6-phosphate 1-dehydrogenase
MSHSFPHHPFQDDRRIQKSGHHYDRMQFWRRTGEETPYERLLGDAMKGDGALFTREEAVEAAWEVVDWVLKTHHRVRPYKRGTWGPKAADALIAANGGWHNPSSIASSN